MSFDKVENEQFFGYYHVELPDHLELRGGDTVFFIGILITLSFLLLAWAVKLNQRIPVVLPKLFMSALQTDQKYKEFMRMGSTASILLLLNYLITSFILLFLALSTIKTLSYDLRIYLSIIAPIGLFALQLVPTYLISFLSGASLPLPSATANTLSGYQVVGGIFVLLAIVWALNPELSKLMITLFALVLLAAQVLRFSKNTYLLLLGGVSWYYLLLYLCTLEILPLFVAYYVFSANFIS
jgi:hypothetical protein